MARRSSIGKSILAFFMGFVFAFLLEAATIAGITYFVLKTDLENIFNLVKVENKRETEEGTEYIFVNTDENQGGVKDAWALIQRLSTMAQDYQNITLGEFEEVLPVTNKLTTALHDGLQEYVELNVEKLKQVKFDQLGDYIMGEVKGVHVANVLNKVAPEMLTDPVFSTMLYGSEASYVTVAGMQFPVFYEEFKVASEEASVGEGEGAAPTYVRVQDGAAVNLTPYQDYLVKKGNNYRIYYFNVEVGGQMVHIVTNKDYEFLPESMDAEGVLPYTYTLFNEEYSICTGGYYMQNSERVQVRDVRLGDFMEGDVLALFEDVKLSGFVGGGDGLQALADLTVGDLLNVADGDYSSLNEVPLTDFIQTEDESMAKLLEGLTLGGLLGGGEGGIDGIKDKYLLDLLGNVQEGDLVYKLLDGVTFGDLMDPSSGFSFDDQIDKITLADVMDVSVGNSISSKVMSYLVYGISDYKSSTGKATYHYTEEGVKKTEEVTVVVKDGLIQQVLRADNTQVMAAGINDISKNIDSVMDVLNLADVLELKVGDEVSDKIMLYLVYRVTEVNPTAVAGVYTASYHKQVINEETNMKETVKVSATIYADATGKITSVEAEGKEVAPTGIQGVSDVMSEIMDVITFADLMKVKCGETLSDQIMTYLAFGISDLQASGEHTYTATYYETVEGELVGSAAVVTVNATKEIVSVQVGERTITAAGVNAVTERMDSMMQVFRLGDFIEINEHSNKILKKLENCKINEIGAEIDKFTVSDVMDIPEAGDSVAFGDKVMIYLAYGITYDGGKYWKGTEEVEVAVTNGKITAARLVANNELVPATKISEIGGQLDGITNVFAISDFISITDSSLMLYLSYGVTDYDRTAHTGKVNGENVTVQVNTDGTVQSVMKGEERIAGVKISQISHQIDGMMNDLRLGDVVELAGNGSNNGLMEKLSNCKISEVDSIINDITLGDVMSVDVSNAMMRYLVYSITDYDAGTQTATYHYTEGGVKKSKVVSVNVQEGKIDSISADGVTIGATKVTEVSNQIDGLMNDLKIKDLMPSATGVLAKLGEYDLNHINEGINQLTIADVLGEGNSSNSILKRLEHCKIQELDERLASLSMQEMYPQDVYNTTKSNPTLELEAGFKATRVYYKVNEAGEYVLANGTGKLTAWEEGIYTYGDVAGMWKMILCERVLVDGEYVYNENVYAIDKMSQLMNNAVDNIQKSTLYVLQEIGIINNTINLNKKLADKALGTYTIDGLLMALSFIAS